MKHLFAVYVVFASLMVSGARADGGDDTEASHEARQDWVAPDTSGQAPLDPRLPPVVPGETVVRGGNEIKVWSTAGSPSISTEASPSIAQGKGVTVIVDGRKRRGAE